MIARQHGSSSANERKMARSLLATLLVALILFGGLLVLHPWIKTTFGAPTLFMVSVVVALFALCYASYFLVNWQRRLDEAHRASAAFAGQWGQWVGVCAFVLLLMAPPFHDFAVTLIERATSQAGAPVDRQVVAIAMTIAFTAVVLLQAIGAAVLSIIWWTSRR